jgi:23S rRNA (adenine2503-C2)-methyltransferase
MQHFFDFNPDTLAAFCAEGDLPRFAAKQIMEWVYQKGITDPQQMTNLSKAGRTWLAENVVFCRGEIVAHQRATDETQKLLIEWHGLDGRKGLPVISGNGGAMIDRRTECVMIPTEKRRTACLSSQVGCPVGCTFCASGLGGLDGNLTAGQIVEQVYWLSDVGSQPSANSIRRQPIAESRPRITNIVFMGMGEPLANFGAVTNAIRTLNAPWGFGISARRITVSTVGLPRAIRKLVEFEIPVTLALSLHAPNDQLRRELIPWAEYATIDELLDACDEYFQKTGREITLEYLLLRNVNDRPEHAQELASVAKKLRANVNLIRYNEVRGLPFDRPTTEDVREFQDILREKHVNAHLRASRGRDIAAACGQLRHEKKVSGVR